MKFSIKKFDSIMKTLGGALILLGIFLGGILTYIKKTEK